MDSILKSCSNFVYEMRLAYYMYLTILTEMNVSATVGMSATVEERSRTMGEMSGTVEGMSRTLKECLRQWRKCLQ